MMTLNAPDFPDGADIALLHGEFIDVFSLLGMHRAEHEKGLVVRCFLRGALSVEVLSLKDGRRVASLNKINEEGLFAGRMGRRVNPFPYKLKVEYPHSREEIIDPYQFSSLLNPDDVYLFGEGRQQQTYGFMGANWREQQGINGVHFCVWAPNARRVSLIGDFNHWDGSRHIMRQHLASGLWEIFIADASAGQYYKFEIITANGECLRKADPYAFDMQQPPNNASRITTKVNYGWKDGDWMERRSEIHWHNQPMSIYEVHLASWRRKGENGEAYLNYAELIEELIPYVKQMGFTHLQLMPISEYPFDGSWGYQPVGLYAPSHRFGDSVGLKSFIDACHADGIGVLLDWVAGHFPRDPHGLASFDGSYLYEHEDPRQGEHPDWDTLIFNYGRAEVRSFLLSNASYWLKEFHFDGLRLDAVSSMLYLDYSREPGEWLPNFMGGRENLEAISFLQELNGRMYQSFPGITMIAEESTSWPGVSHSVEDNGLGFGFKWNMGWMNDSLSYLRSDPLFRCHHHHSLTFGLMYAYSEQFILPLSHDEVVHGKGSLLEKIPGDDWQKFATLRAFLGFMWGHPGKKLLFMGNEFAQRAEWDHDFSLDWHLLHYAPHQGMQQWVKDLNHLYVNSPALFSQDSVPAGFAWIDCDNSHASIFAFVRYGLTEEDHLLFVINMKPELHTGFRLGLPSYCHYQERLNSDSEHYGGCNQGNGGQAYVEPIGCHGMAQSTMITVPPLACLVFSPDKPLSLPPPLTITNKG